MAIEVINQCELEKAELKKAKLAWNIIITTTTESDGCSAVRHAAIGYLSAYFKTEVVINAQRQFWPGDAVRVKANGRGSKHFQIEAVRRTITGDIVYEFDGQIWKPAEIEPA